MRVIPWEDLVGGRQRVDGPVCLTIGVFDGLHVGHQRLMSTIRQEGCTSLVITFRLSPAAVLGRKTFPGMLLSFSQRLERLEGIGIDSVAVIDFSVDLSKLTGRDFVGLLRENLTIGKIAVGYNFRFGKHRGTGTDALKEMLGGTGTEVQVVEPVLYGGEIVSSSRIRKSVQEGRFKEAEDMLTQAFSLDLRGVPAAEQNPGGSRRTVSMRRADIWQCLPMTGSYPVSCEAGTATLEGLLTVRKGSVELELLGDGASAEWLRHSAVALGKITSTTFR